VGISFPDEAVKDGGEMIILLQRKNVRKRGCYYQQ
jgi:hypothetical protein